MISNKLYKTVCLVLVAGLFAFPAIGSDLPVKKSKSDICHPLGGTYYARTKNYTPYPTMEACIKSGGRYPKR